MRKHIVTSGNSTKMQEAGKNFKKILFKFSFGKTLSKKTQKRRNRKTFFDFSSGNCASKKKTSFFRNCCRIFVVFFFFCLFRERLCEKKSNHWNHPLLQERKKKMWKSFSLFAFLFLLCVERSHSEQGGGTKCAACTIVARMIVLAVDPKSKSGGHTLEETISNLCMTVDKRAPEARKQCDLFLKSPKQTKERMLKEFSILLEEKSPDQICAGLGACTNITGCPLYPGKGPSPSPKEMDQLSQGEIYMFNFATYFENLLHNISNDLNEHIPVDDPDHDYFSGEYETLRGRNWRGRDCEGQVDTIYPGRVPHNSDTFYDSNCNGIYGVDPQTNTSYEDLYCNIEQRGLMILGDSIGAHFAFPTSWYFISKEAYRDFFYTLANEICWPQMSTYTGFVSYTGADKGWGDCPDLWQESPCSLDSVYLEMRSRNLCIHRDFQNLAVSGADSYLAVGNVHAIARNQATDRPALFFYAMIGDDICDHKSESGWTTPEAFRANVLETLDFLNTTLPPNSAVPLIGLVDGRVLWEINFYREYPLGGITYADFWDYLNCLEISYCYGWLNSDPAVRNAAFQRAEELNAQLMDIAANVTYVNFEMDYYPYPLAEASAEWIAQGGEPWELIEPFDGLHASQVTNALIAKQFVRKLERDHPDWLGKVNPNNDNIRQRFNDQGGY